MGKIRLVRIKTATTTMAAKKKLSEIDKFQLAIQKQISMLKSHPMKLALKKDKSLPKSWLVDGSSYGQKWVLVPRIGTVKVWSTSAIPVAGGGRLGVAELTNLFEEVEAGKLNNRIYTSLRNAKKKKPKSARKKATTKKK